MGQKFDLWASLLQGRLEKEVRGKDKGNCYDLLIIIMSLLGKGEILTSL